MRRPALSLGGFIALATCWGCQQSQPWAARVNLQVQVDGGTTGIARVSFLKEGSEVADWVWESAPDLAWDGPQQVAASVEEASIRVVAEWTEFGCEAPACAPRVEAVLTRESPEQDLRLGWLAGSGPGEDAGMGPGDGGLATPDSGMAADAGDAGVSDGGWDAGPPFPCGSWQPAGDPQSAVEDVAATDSHVFAIRGNKVEMYDFGDSQPKFSHGCQVSNLKALWANSLADEVYVLAQDSSNHEVDIYRVGTSGCSVAGLSFAVDEVPQALWSAPAAPGMPLRLFAAFSNATLAAVTVGGGAPAPQVWSLQSGPTLKFELVGLSGVHESALFAFGVRSDNQRGLIWRHVPNDPMSPWDDVIPGPMAERIHSLTVLNSSEAVAASKNTLYRLQGSNWSVNPTVSNFVPQLTESSSAVAFSGEKLLAVGDSPAVQFHNGARWQSVGQWSGFQPVKVVGTQLCKTALLGQNGKLRISVP